MAGDKQFLTAFALWSAFGVELAVAVVFGLWLGVRVDQYLGSSPWGLVGGLLIGMSAGVGMGYRLLKYGERFTQ